MGLCVASFLSYLAYDRLFGKRPDSRSAAAVAQSPTQDGGRQVPQPPPGRMTTVTLDESKFAVAKIKLMGVRGQRSRRVRRWSGRSRRIWIEQVEIRPRASGIVREAPAKLGQHVKRGERS